MFLALRFIVVVILIAGFGLGWIARDLNQLYKPKKGTNVFANINAFWYGVGIFVVFWWLGIPQEFIEIISGLFR